MIVSCLESVMERDEILLSRMPDLHDACRSSPLVRVVPLDAGGILADGRMGVWRANPHYRTIYIA
jgi:hypothetical protein